MIADDIAKALRSAAFTQEILIVLEEREVSELIYLSLSEMTALLKLPDSNTKHGARDRFYIILLYDSGARDFEILNLPTEKFKINKNGTGEIQILGKGNKSRTTPISKEVVKPCFLKSNSILHAL